VLFSLVLGWLPSSQIKSIEYDELSAIGKFIDLFKHLILPVVVLGIFSSASTIKYMKGSVSEILKKDYILFARMNGLSERKIFFNHVLRNSLNPIFTLFGLYFPLILGGAAVIEYVFALPGLGRIGIDSIFARDYPVIIAITFIAGIMVAIGNIIADLLIIINDPRLKGKR
jgi:peptide/nickel transport system permease protein